MADDANSEPVPSTPAPEDEANEALIDPVIDPVGQSVLELLHKATSLAGGNSRS